MPVVAHFIPPCQPTHADRPPRTPNWIHEIKHDGYRLMVRRDGSGIQFGVRGGWSAAVGWQGGMKCATTGISILRDIEDHDIIDFDQNVTAIGMRLAHG